MQQKQLFRKVALERLSSPEQLDQLMQVTTPKGWLALVGLVAVLAVIVVWGFVGNISVSLQGNGLMLKTDSLRSVRSPYMGQIRQLLVKEQQAITANQVIALIGPDNLQVTSPFNGAVSEIQSGEGDVVAMGDSLFSLTLLGAAKNDLLVTVYLPASEAKQITAGMAARVSPSTVRQEEYGFILGEVVNVNEFPSTREGMLRTLGSSQFVDKFNDIEAPVEIRIKLTSDPETPSGYKWSSRGPDITIGNGTPCTVEIVLRHQNPINLIIP